MSACHYPIQHLEVDPERAAMDRAGGWSGKEEAIMNPASPLFHEDYAPIHAHRGRLLPLAISMLCYASLLGALIASAYLV